MRYYYTYMIYINNPESRLFGKVYYGQHVTKNLNDGYITSGRIIKDYIKKYPNAYYRKILNLYNSQEELNQAEYELIHPHLGKYYCLNLRDGGYKGTLTNEVKRKISESHIGKKISAETIKKRTQTRKSTYKHSKETIEKIRLGNLGKTRSEETKQKISEKLKGHKLSEGIRQKISENLKGHKLSEDTKQRISNTLKGKYVGRKSAIQGKHKVWDNKDLNIYHFE